MNLPKFTYTKDTPDISRGECLSRLSACREEIHMLCLALSNETESRKKTDAALLSNSDTHARRAEFWFFRAACQLADYLSQKRA